MNLFEQPAESTGEVLVIESLENAIVQRGIGHWRSLKGARPFPDRREITLRGLGSVLPHVILVKILEDDYEYRLVGDALVQGFGDNFTGKRLSAIRQSDPKFGHGLELLYEMVRIDRHPVGHRGHVGSDMRGALFAYHESAILPFGPSGGAVDHLLIVAAITLRTALAG